MLRAGWWIHSFHNFLKYIFNWSCSCNQFLILWIMKWWQLGERRWLAQGHTVDQGAGTTHKVQTRALASNKKGIWFATEFSETCLFPKVRQLYKYNRRCVLGHMPPTALLQVITSMAFYQRVLKQSVISSLDNLSYTKKRECVLHILSFS